MRWIVSGAAIALTTVSVIGVGAVAERNARAALGRELQNRLLLAARNLALASSGALLSDFPELTLSPILAELVRTQPELELAVVVDLEEKIRGHADARRIGSKLELPVDLLPVDPIAEILSGESVLSSPSLLAGSVPVAHAGGNRVGRAVVAIQQSYIDEVIASAREKQLAFLAVLLALAIGLAFVLMSVLMRPIGALREGLERIGRGDLDTPVRLKDRTELGLLAETMNRMSKDLREAQKERIERERLAREVELAREIQSSLLPSAPARIGKMVIHGAHRAAAEVGGDYYDVLPLADGRTAFAIADVSGKGLAGCLVTSMLSALLRAFRDMESSPKALLVRLEKELSHSLRPGTFITMFYGILDPRTGEILFASAGHCPLLVLRKDGKAEWLKSPGTPIGALRGGALAKTLCDERIVLGSEDLLIQYTDGINEAFDMSGKNQFGLKRLEESAVRSSKEGCAAVIDGILRDVARWVGDQPPLDDETLLVLGCEARDSAGDERAIEVGLLKRIEDLSRRSECLRLKANLESLSGIRDWLLARPAFAGLDSRTFHAVESAVYELCANVVEHGYGKDATQSLDLYWLANEGREGPREARSPERRGCGRFVVVDHGKRFRPEGRRIDLNDPSVRRRRRGFGLEIIQEVMSQVSFQPSTPLGNVTVLEFDPEEVWAAEEVSHG
jgi:serine phosphatase RsbU (regulator of sigma subunit)/anti-sigma regulatory factor (Ser/Thr protein kinase)